MAEKAWLTDKTDVLDMILSKWPGVIDVEAVHLIGQNMLDYMRRKEAMLDIIMKDDLATRIYSEGGGLAEANRGMCGVLEQISHKFPQANYVEIGGGTGSTVSISDSLLIFSLDMC